MKKILYIDACIRDENSRTKAIATPIVDCLKEKYEVETILINDLKLQPVLKQQCIQRSNGIVDELSLNLARKLASADKVVIAAPFWDMSFPSALKVFFEQVSLFNVTFTQTADGWKGLCKADKLLYITTRGMRLKTGEALEQATPYLKALCWLWGIDDVLVLASDNMDFDSEEVNKEKIANAIAEGLKICEDF